MRNALIITGGIVAGFAVLGGLWWYLLLNGAPVEVALENPFASGEEADRPVVEPLREAGVEVSQASLRRIGERPVAGAIFIEEEGRTLIHYAELGTGHLYAADPETGTTTRLSGTTLPRTTAALWSSDGTRVVLTTETSSGIVRPLLGTLTESNSGSSTTLTTVELDRAAQNLAFSEDGATLYYTLPTTTGSAGYAQDVETGVREVLFSSPLRALHVLWDAPRVAYTSPSAAADGYAFRISDGARLAGSVSGLMLEQAGERLVFSHLEEGELVSATDAPGGVPLAITVFPEKCDADPLAMNILWCAAPANLSGVANLPDTWYQGAVVLDDELWQLNVATGSATLLSVPSEEAGVEIDATELSVDSSGSYLIFINKRDGGLWLQETG